MIHGTQAEYSKTKKKRSIELTKRTTILAKRRAVLPCLSSTRTTRTSSARAEVANSFAAASVFRLDTPTPNDARWDGQKKRGKNDFICSHDRYLGRTRKKVTTYCAGTYFLRQLPIASAVRPSRSSVFALYVRASLAFTPQLNNETIIPCTVHAERINAPARSIPVPRSFCSLVLQRTSSTIKNYMRALQ